MFAWPPGGEKWWLEQYSWETQGAKQCTKLFILFKNSKHLPKQNWKVPSLMPIRVKKATKVDLIFNLDVAFNFLVNYIMYSTLLNNCTSRAIFFNIFCLGMHFFHSYLQESSRYCSDIPRNFQVCTLIRIGTLMPKCRAGTSLVV